MIATSEPEGTREFPWALVVHAKADSSSLVHCNDYIRDKMKRQRELITRMQELLQSRQKEILQLKLRHQTLTDELQLKINHLKSKKR